VRLTVVGCAGSFPAVDSAASCYLVQAAAAGRTWTLLLDLGNGALGPLQEHWEPADVDAIGLSHLHSDHMADMCVLHVYLQYRPRAMGVHQRRAIPVYGPFGTASRLAEACGSDLGEVAEHLAIHTWQPGTPVSVGPMTVTPFAVRHPIPAYGVRITGPSEDDPDNEVVLAYSGDTDSCSGLDQLALGADLLLAEASFLEERDTVRGIHLTARRAGELAAKSAVGRLVLTHIPAWNDREESLEEAREAFDGAISLARPGLVFRL
jgi:ribonuclease BN (tRNA processing enzyme)